MEKQSTSFSNVDGTKECRETIAIDFALGKSPSSNVPLTANVARIGNY